MSGGINLADYGPWVVIPFGVALLASFVWIGWAVIRSKPLPITPALLAIALMGGAVWATSTPVPDEWETFKAAHNCKVVGKSEGHSNGGVGITTRGSVAFIAGDRSPDQTGYLCDDGVTYWKNER
ncbi:hypothetical protein [Pseudomonas juntendi]|uniref:Uncharacterized protein n=1 Tax=Pseudomonas juntendi TaxID=2666183 RepID=A0A7W2JME3_9PSED|nr:hypothetical protein [Pseudomonas juntendi]EJG5355167.1 hypothetical protein [Salmonella enterica]EPL59885.1 hypothetical protein B382_24178 [Stutzerimonas stutzeri B1SMN1]MBA6061664.1 hypothetical protein [Pseudomonas juntendi]